MPYTSDPLANQMIETLSARIQSVLGARLVGLYLDGSIATGAFDASSDIDFVAALDGEIDEELFQALYAMHKEVQALPSPWSIQIEGSYLPTTALRRYDPAHMHYPNIERDAGERLKWTDHDEGWNFHRYVLRERGVVLVGPPAAELIDAVSAEDLRRAARYFLTDWFAGFLTNPAQMGSRGYQSYTVLSLCRIRYTLVEGAVTSKPGALQWAREHLDPRWRDLIEQAWHDRSEASRPLDDVDVQATLAFIRDALEHLPPQAD